MLHMASQDIHLGWFINTALVTAHFYSSWINIYNGLLGAIMSLEMFNSTESTPTDLFGDFVFSVAVFTLVEYRFTIHISLSEVSFNKKYSNMT